MSAGLIKNLRINEKSKRISFYLADTNMSPIKYGLVNNKNSNETFEEFLEEIVYSIVVSKQFLASGMSKSARKINYAKVIAEREIKKWILENKSEKLNEKKKKSREENVIEDIYYDFYDTFDKWNLKIDPELKIKAKKFFSETIVPLFCKKYNED